MAGRAGFVDAPGDGGLQHAAQQHAAAPQVARQQVTQPQAEKQQAAAPPTCMLMLKEQQKEASYRRLRAIVPWSNPIGLERAREEAQALIVHDRRFAAQVVAQQRGEREARELEQTPPSGAALKLAKGLFYGWFLMLACGAAYGLVPAPFD